MNNKPEHKEMEFPARSASTTDQLFTWEEVRGFLDKETTRRSEYIARLLEALREKFGEEVMDVASKVIYNIGYEKGAMRARMVKEKQQKNDLESLAGLISHTTAKLYLGNQVEVDGDLMTVTEDYCPHPKKWHEMGFPLPKVTEYCLLFDQVDKGMIEGYNEKFEAELTGCWNLGENGVCQMYVRCKGAGK
ncbi:MAG: L-2-amino-thiazoline-4-carboxylic acid hydrolase [Anaerolineaceae bacterium]|nr:L-2-amino-thiazoline-4-carboxylic acid hydrolase [Anaerolineaceae bacterium]